MSIETRCPGCGRTLQVGDEHAGKQARCPLCSEIYVVPANEPAPAEKDTAMWQMRTPEGQTFGPVTRAELTEWIFEGRVSSECLLSSDGQPNWISADAIFPELAPAAPRPNLDRPAPATRYITPHRGPLILALAVMSWPFFCPIFGICAWVMASTDLREMQAGRMDSSGSGMTQAGQLIGMIHALIAIVLAVIGVFLVLLGFGWR
jgi:hypothetical protein